MKKIYILGNIANISAGQGAPQKESDFSDVGNPFIRAGNLAKLIEGYSEYDVCDLINDDTAKRYGLRLYPKDTIVFAKSGKSTSKGYVHILSRECYIVNHLACINIYNNDSSYMKYYFMYHKPNKLIKDEAYPSISLADIRDMKINIHDIQTQKEIVAVLDKVTSLISMRKEQLGKLDVLVKSKFIEMFGDPVLNPKGWEKKKLGEVCDQIRGITYKSQDVEESLNSNSIMLLRANNISNDGTINYDNIIFINKNKVNSIQFIKINDILVCASSGSVHLVGKAAQIKEYKLLTFGAFCKVVRPKNINPIYIGQFFQSAYYRKTISTLAQGANINNIRNEDIDNITIPIPPLDLQNQFAEFVEQVEKNKEKIKSSLNQLETLYSALMQEYFG